MFVGNWERLANFDEFREMGLLGQESKEMRKGVHQLVGHQHQEARH